MSGETIMKIFRVTLYIIFLFLTYLSYYFIFPPDQNWVDFGLLSQKIVLNLFYSFLFFLANTLTT